MILRRKLSLFVAMVILAVTITAGANGVSYAEEPGDDITGKVTIDSVDLMVYRAGSWHYAIKDGVADDTYLPIKKNDYVKLEINWGIKDADMSGIGANDYFDISLPVEHISTADSGELDIINKSDPSKPLGKWQIVSGKIHAVLNDNVEGKNNITGGYFISEGYAKSGGENISLEVGGVILPPIDFGTEPNPGEGGGRGEYPDYGLVHKNGYTVPNSDMLNWSIRVNMENAKKVFEQEDPQQLNNVMLVDRMEGGQSVKAEDVAIQAYVHYPTSDGKMSGQAFGMSGIMDQFQLIKQLENETYDAFYDRIKTYSGPAFGVYDREVVVISFQNLPNNGNGIKGWDNDTALYNKIYSSGTFTDNEKDYMYNAYKSTNKAKGDIIGFVVSIKAKAEGGSKKYSNKAELSYNDTSESDSSWELSYKELEGGAKVGEPGDLVINKINEDKEALADVSFKLQKKDSNGTYQDYTTKLGETVLKTDEDGQIIFKNLHNGQYKIVEVEGLKGYKKEVTFDPGDEFTIDGTETAAIIVSVINYKEEEPSSSSEEESTEKPSGESPTLVSPTSESSLESQTTEPEATTASGGQPATGDESSMTLYLGLVVLAALAMTATAISSVRKRVFRK